MLSDFSIPQKGIYIDIIPHFCQGDIFYVNSFYGIFPFVKRALSSFLSAVDKQVSGSKRNAQSEK
jgi:hypothetical protein